MSYIHLIIVATGLLIMISMLVAMIYSLAEKAYRAACWSFIFALILPLPFFINYIFPYFFSETYDLVLFIVLVIIFLAFLYNPSERSFEPGQPVTRCDERETMFSRRELVPDTEKYTVYYKNHPLHVKPDENWRVKPGLLSPDSVFYHPLSFAAADASFSTIAIMGDYINGNVNYEQMGVSAKKLTLFIKKWMAKQGVVDVGITTMKTAHYYHTKGRGKLYNHSVTPRYKYGIALTVEMDEHMMAASPKGSALMESADQYLKSGVPAVQLAHFLREAGYEAKAHIDGNYEVICPLVARDAGLGEIGRMGLLMTPKQGPRVRIAVVTTNAPLICDNPSKAGKSINEFCHYCKKCARVCPSQSIPFDERKIQQGALRWKINSESCFNYWNVSGTDCGRCMAVCPYSHADNLMHNFVRFGIRYSKLFRRIAVVLDDLFYGKKPQSRPLPKWM